MWNSKKNESLKVAEVSDKVYNYQIEEAKKIQNANKNIFDVIDKETGNDVKKYVQDNKNALNILRANINAVKSQLENINNQDNSSKRGR